MSADPTIAERRAREVERQQSSKLAPRLPSRFGTKLVGVSFPKFADGSPAYPANVERLEQPVGGTADGASTTPLGPGVVQAFAAHIAASAWWYRWQRRRIRTGQHARPAPHRAAWVRSERAGMGGPPPTGGPHPGGKTTQHRAGADASRSPPLTVVGIDGRRTGALDHHRGRSATTVLLPADY